MMSSDSQEHGFVASVARELLLQCVVWLPIGLLVGGIFGGLERLKLAGLAIGGAYVLLFAAWLIWAFVRIPREARRDWQHLGPLGRVIYGAGHSLIAAGVALCVYAGIALWTLTR